MTWVELSDLSIILWILITTYAVVSPAGFHLRIDRKKELWVGSALGIVNGVLTGMTGSLVVPGVIYVQVIDLQRDELTRQWACSSLFPSFPLYLSILGMFIGQRIRKRLSEAVFRKVFYILACPGALYRLCVS